jgi:predicted dehydrogenase
MDLMSQPLSFRVRKAARYTRLYGPRRTLVKIRGQYHLANTRGTSGELSSPGSQEAHVGIIGCGGFAYSHIAYYLKKNFGYVMRGAMDVDAARAASLARAYRMHYSTDDARRIFEDPSIDLVFVASNHASHADYAIEALRAGKNVHIEKPHAVSEEQLVRLCRAVRETGGRVALGFNRPGSELGRRTRELLAAQSGPAMLNWFVAGHAIPPDHWYFREEEGGRILGNLCHWTDFTYQMLSASARYPIRIRPTSNRPLDADLVVSYVFGDGSLAAIAFSAKGHTFEGVREHLEAQRGNLLLSLSDFKRLDADIVEHRERRRLLFRDHGHEATIRRSYALSGRAGRAAEGCTVQYLWETGELFLKTKEAVEQGSERVLEPFDPGVLQG